MHVVLARSLVLVLVWLAWGGIATARDRPIHFDRDIRPILSNACYQCHGPDEARRKAKLRLDTQEGLFDLRESGAIVAPGNPDASLLIDRIESDDDTMIMPPPESGKQLSEAERTTLRRWVREGAVWSGHWAYEPLQRPRIPSATTPWGGTNPIDAFLAEGYRAQSLPPAPRAEPHTLLRRLSFDLIGLPPRPEDVDAFLADSSPAAYGRHVDRLLASPHHGERLAQYWLDLVRYADTVGYHGDNHQEIWLYRDWVIQAFNANMPFDRFTREQLAGDLLQPASTSQLVASGYNRLLMTTREGGAQAAEYLAKYAADRVRNVSTVWMGATLGCAQCHDHKYDPFGTRDFYALAAYFADIQETAVGEQEPTRIASPGQQSELNRIETLLQAASEASTRNTPQLEAARMRWESERRARRAQWKPAQPPAQPTAPITIGPNGEVELDPTTREHEYQLIGSFDLETVSALQLEVMPLKTGAPSRRKPAADAPGLRAMGLRIAGADAPFSCAQGDADTPDNSPKLAIDGDPQTAWVLPASTQPRFAVFNVDPPASGSAPASFALQLTIDHGPNLVPVILRLCATDAPGPHRPDPTLPGEIEEILATEPAARSSEQVDALNAFYRTIAPELAATRDAIAALQVQRQRILNTLPTTLVTRAMPEPRPTRILPRGNWLDDSGELVTPAPPAFLASHARTQPRATRLDLADWIVGAENPLTARVFVNRLWKLFFGRGLVATADDLGTQGARPTHPELLDWLSAEFVASGWDIRHIIRLIVTSQAYQASSRPTPEAIERDPANDWLSHQARYRLDGEQIRDLALSASGLLVNKLGGPSARPFQPPGYWSYLNFPPREYETGQAPDVYRRGLYTYWCRTFLHPSLNAFDAPTREECTVERPRSNTPIQALVLLNDPNFVEAARALAGRVSNEAPSNLDAQLDRAFLLVLSRPPRPEERTELRALHAQHQNYFQQHLDQAEALLRVGHQPSRTSQRPAELAALTSVMRALLNLHEAVSRN